VAQKVKPLHTALPCKIRMDIESMELDPPRQARHKMGGTG
jgi:hypothetical protein